MKKIVVSLFCFCNVLLCCCSHKENNELSNSDSLQQIESDDNFGTECIWFAHESWYYAACDLSDSIEKYIKKDDEFEVQRNVFELAYRYTYLHSLFYEDHTPLQQLGYSNPLPDSTLSKLTNYVSNNMQINDSVTLYLIDYLRKCNETPLDYR